MGVTNYATYLIETVLILIIVLLFIYIIIKLVLAKAFSPILKSQYITIVERIQLGQSQTLYLIEIGGEGFLIIVTANMSSVIKHYNKTEWRELKGKKELNQKPPFKQLIRIKPKIKDGSTKDKTCC